VSQCVVSAGLWCRALFWWHRIVLFAGAVSRSVVSVVGSAHSMLFRLASVCRCGVPVFRWASGAKAEKAREREMERKEGKGKEGT
jgi:hypothetical protein